jgi:hypothetical protein
MVEARLSFPGFAEKELDVLRHDDLGVEGDVVGVPGLFDDSFEDVLGSEFSR